MKDVLFALILLLAFATSCGGGDSTNADTSTDTGTDAPIDSSTDAATDAGADAVTDTGADTAISGSCTDDAACTDLGLVCNEYSGICVASSCEGKDDFTMCETVTSPDRSYDICVDEVCVSPGCGDTSCNAPGPHFPLPDTNQRQCYDAEAATTCPSAGESFYGQDAQFGWDTTHAATERFTRDLSTSSQPVVDDEVTALVWQGCPLGLSGDDCATGAVNKAAWADQLASCDSLSWGGHDDWRLPDLFELQTLVDHDTTGAPVTDAAAFPATPSEWVWSSSSRVATSWAWTVQFAFGTLAFDIKENGRPARCVRAGSPQARRFEVSTPAGDRVVTDNVNEVMWQGCPDGTSDDVCGTGTITWSTWEEALAFCEALSWGGHTDWRLPDVTGLQSLVDHRHASPSVDPVAFPGLVSVGWTSSTRAAFTSGAWTVNFEFGTTFAVAKTDAAGSVRCVRDE